MVAEYTYKFVWDGWLLIAELDGQDAVVRTCAWGLDVSGSPGGAGGVGGLAFESLAATGATHLALYDGNGNLTSLRDDTGAISAAYEYGPFGETLTTGGSPAALSSNAFKFSTKYTDAESGLLYYGYRYYNQGTGRWLSRDPIEERDGPNFYVYICNNTPAEFDSIGLWGTDVHLDATTRWAGESGYPSLAARTLGESDESVDGKGLSQGKSFYPWAGDQSYHFDRNLGKGKDSRIKHYEEHLAHAKIVCSRPLDDPDTAVEELGIALHPYQDWVAHGEYGIYNDGQIWSIHNAGSPQRTWGDPSNYPDMTQLDAVQGPGGRAAGWAMHYEVTFIGTVREYAIYKFGYRRLSMTHKMTTDALVDFRAFVRAYGDCRCKEYFGVD